MIDNIETISQVVLSCNKIYPSQEVFDILNAGKIPDTQKSWLHPYYDPNKLMAQLSLHDWSCLLQFINNYIELSYMDGNSIDHISDSFIGIIISHFIERYHTHLDYTLWYSSYEMGRHFSLDTYINFLQKNDIYSEIFEYFVSIKEVIYLLDWAGYLIDYEKNAMLITHERIQWWIITEMSILRWIMKEDQSKYNYFSYGEVDRILHPSNSLFASNCFAITKRINYIRSNIQNKQYSEFWWDILVTVLNQLYIWVMAAQFNKKLYKWNPEDFDLLIYCVKKSLTD